MFSEFVVQNILWFIALLVVLNLLVFSFFQGRIKGVGSISALQLPRLQREGDAVIIDVSDAAEYQRGHIPESRNFPLSNLNDNDKELVKLKDHTAIIVCATGTRSNKAAKILQQLGFNKLHIMQGGMISWNKENLPVSAASK